MTTLYEKRGRRYHPVAEYSPEMIDSLPDGFHLLIVTPGRRTTVLNVIPNTESVLAAIRQHRDEMEQILLDALRAKPQESLLNDREKAAMAILVEESGRRHVRLMAPSVNKAVGAFEKALTKAAMKNRRE